MSKSIKVLKYFGKIEGGQVFDEGGTITATFL